jgi:DNA-directed RNA polymerase omega subunit
LETFGKLDSKYRFIILASKRAKQLLKGAKPKLQTRSKSPIRIAQAEVQSGLVEYEIIPARMDDIPEREERVFVGGGLGDEPGDADSLAGKDLVEDEADVVLEEEAEEGAGEADEEPEEEAEKDDKDD